MREPFKKPESDEEPYKKLLGLDESFSVKSHYPGFKAAERGLVESEARFRAMFEAVPFRMFLADALGEILLSNQSRLGDGRDEYAGSIRKLDADGSPRWSLEIRKPVTISGRVQGVLGVDIDVTDQKLAEESLKTLADRLERQVRTRTKALRRANQELVLKRISLERALSDLRGAQANLVQTKYLASVGRVLASIAHELNNPLASTVSAADHLASIRKEAANAIRRYRSLSVQLADFVDRLLAHEGEAMYISSRRRRELAKRLVEAGCDRADEIADDLCDLGMPKLSGDDLATASGPGGEEAVRIAWILGSMFGSAALVAKAARKAGDVVRSLDAYLELAEPRDTPLIKFDLEERLSRYPSRYIGRCRPIMLTVEDGLAAYGDPERLDLVWENLVDNAAYAAGSSGLVSIEARSDGGGVRITVRDDGPGIDHSIADRIFEPLFSTKALEEGQGLGLDICRRIIDTHGGSIYFESEPGNTVFTVVLPGPPDGAMS